MRDPKTIGGPLDTISQLQLSEKGGDFKIVHVSKPSLSPDQVLIRQTVVALNGLDWKQRDMGLFIGKWPHVLGIEGAGIIEEVGSEVTDWDPGDEVAAWMAGMAHGEDWGGAYQDHVVMPAMYVIKKPRNIGLDELASLPITYVTSVCAIRLGMGISYPQVGATLEESAESPRSVLVLGGSSSGGGSLIQLLRLAFPKLPIIATASPGHHARVASLGATHLLDYHSPTVLSDINATSPDGRGVDMVVDCVGAGAKEQHMADVFRPDGSKRYAAITTGDQFPEMKGVTRTDVSGADLVNMRDARDVFRSLTALIEDGKFQPPVPVKLIVQGLENIPSVMDQTKTVSGQKLLVRI